MALTTLLLALLTLQGAAEPSGPRPAATGALVPFVPLRADVELLEVRNLDLATWRVEGTLELLPEDGERAGVRWRARALVRPPEGPPRLFEAEAADGVYTAVEPAARRWVRGPVPAPGELGAGTDPWLAPLLLARPWLDAPARRELSVEEPRDFDGERCEVLRRGSDLWHLSSATGLPRLVTTVRPMELGESVSTRASWSYGEPPTSLALLEVGSDLQRAELPEPPPVTTTPRAPVAVLDGGLESLRSAFNAARGRPRAVGIFSPS